jgi:hypothetical protein
LQAIKAIRVVFVLVFVLVLSRMTVLALDRIESSTSTRKADSI